MRPRKPYEPKVGPKVKVAEDTEVLVKKISHLRERYHEAKEQLCEIADELRAKLKEAEKAHLDHPIIALAENDLKR